MVDVNTVKRCVQELDLAIIEEDPPGGILVVEDKARGITHLVLHCDDPMLILEQKILDVPTSPGELFRRLLEMHRTLVHGAFVLDEAGRSVLWHDSLALAHVDVNAVQGTIDAFGLALAEHAPALIAFSRHGVRPTTQEDAHLGATLAGHAQHRPGTPWQKTRQATASPPMAVLASSLSLPPWDGEPFRTTRGTRAQGGRMV